MTTIRIQERFGESDDSNACVSFGHGPEYSITIHDPFSEEEERQLEWYFEEHLRFPFTRQVSARKAATSITSYGEALFNQIFAHREVYAVYKECLQSGLSKVLVEIAGSPEFHRLHWEALKDPLLPQPLALQTTVVRKNVSPQKIRTSMRPSPTINVLVVTARPFGKRDVGYRTISRSLVEDLRRANLRVQIDILRPGTYKALDQHLREVSAQHGVGYYHVIHFDVHGAVLTYGQLQQGQQASRYLYEGPYGRAPIQKYDGTKAFLFLEEEEKEKADPVEATALANLLINHYIPIVILNACQSGKQIGESETSLGSRLIQEAGVQLVLAMGYSVTVSAAELLMHTLYEQLFINRDLPTAIRYARQELYNRKERRAYFNQNIDLEDWLLPVVYQNQLPQVSVRAFTSEEAQAYHGRQAASYKPHLPSYGFVGRDLDILQIEKRLLTRRNVVLVRGMGGAGKTTLLHHLGEWWQTTSFVEHVFYFGYDKRTWTTQQVIFALAQKLLDQERYVREFQPLSLDAQQAMLAQILRAERHLLVLDNLESITGTQLAIQLTLPPDEQTALHHFLADLVGGRTLVLLGSRSGETWLAKETFADNVYNLSGLDPEAASTLADRILKRHNAMNYRQDADLPKLLKILDGFPLALEVVLANLARQTPKEILSSLQGGNIALDEGNSHEKTTSILRCIDYSYSNLSPEIQKLLFCLAPFTSVIYLPLLEGYVDLLRKEPALSTLPFELWKDVVQQAKIWGLLIADPDLPDFLHLQPILPYFLRSRLNTQENLEQRKAAGDAFLQLYEQLSNELTDLLHSREPAEREFSQMLVHLEYENLMTALDLALTAQSSILNLYLTLILYLDIVEDERRGLELAQFVLDRLRSSPTQKYRESWLGEVASVTDGIAKRQLALRMYREAEAS